MQRALREEFSRTVMSRAFAFINARLAARGGEGFSAGEHLSIADLCIASLCGLIEAGNFEFVPTDFCSRFTAMSALLGRIRVSHSVSQSYVHAPIPDTHTMLILPYTTVIAIMHSLIPPLIAPSHVQSSHRGPRSQSTRTVHHVCVLALLVTVR